MTLERGAFLHHRYRILEILGQGGMGSIYRAIDENLGVEVAVKENLFTTDEYARQFRREAVILANLRHPNLPRVSDHFIVQEQGQYLVMDYIEGEDLRERMDRLGLISENEILVISVAICDALTYMHTRKPPVLHRDIKPGNVKITPQGKIFLVDFGLAKVLHTGQQTSTGARAMTPGYSPPEQYGAARTDHRSDIYSLGATMYAALTGVIPEDSLARTMEQTDLTPVRKRNPKVSRRTAGAIEKALEVHPDDRFQTAEDFKQALSLDRSTTIRKMVDQGVLPVEEETGDASIPANDLVEVPEVKGTPPFLEDSPLPFPVSTALADDSQVPSKRKKRSWGCSIILVILTVIVLAILGIGLAYVLDPGLPWRIFDSTVRVVGLSPEDILPPSLTATSLDETAEGGEPVLVIEPSKTVEPTEPLVSTATPSPTFTLSPTIEMPSETPVPTSTLNPTHTPTPVPTLLGGGYSQIAFASKRTGVTQIWMINVDGTGLRQITDSQWGACQPDWSPDGSRLVYISPCNANREVYRGSGLFIVNVDGTNPVPMPIHGLGDYDPAWSPDGKRIAFTSMRESSRPQILVIDVETKEVQTLSEANSRDMQPSWSSDGSQLVFVSTRYGPYQIWTMNADGSNQTRFSLTAEMKNTNPIFSPDGRYVIFTQSKGQGGITYLRGALYPNGASDEFFVSSLPGVIPMRDAQFSPDGYWLAMESWPNGVMHDIYILALNGAQSIQVTFDPALDFDPTWRPVEP